MTTKPKELIQNQNKLENNNNKLKALGHRPRTMTARFSSSIYLLYLKSNRIIKNKTNASASFLDLGPCVCVKVYDKNDPQIP